MTRRATIEELARWLRACDGFAVIGHVSPDGDAAGSCVAVAMALRAMGKRAFACLPGGMPKMFSRFAGADGVIAAGAKPPFSPETALALDVSDEGRLGDARALFDGCAARAVLDHHATNPGFGDVCLIDGGRAATGELALELIEALGVPLSREMAEWLYIAISTDSGNFSFSSTTPGTMRAAAKLIEAGADVAGLTRELYRTRPLGRTKLLGIVLSGLEVSGDGRMAWARLTDAMFAQAGALREDSDGIVNYLLEIDGVEFAALAETRGAATKFSLRSKEWLDVGRRGREAVWRRRPCPGGGLHAGDAARGSARRDHSIAQRAR